MSSRTGIDRFESYVWYCIDVLTQISAIQAALDKARRDCWTAMPEMMAAVGRLMKRGT